MEMGNLTSIYSIAERMTSSNRRKALFCGAEVAGSRMLGERGGGGKEKGSRREGREGQEYLIPFVTGWILQIIDAFTVRFHNSGNDSSQTICFH